MKWTSHDDPLEFDSFVIKANYHQWESAKGYLHKRYPFNAPFFIETEKAAGLTLQEAKQLRDYLNEKISYLEG